MMNVKISNEHLIEYIKFYGVQAIELRQLANRLMTLLPLRLKKIYASHKKTKKYKSNLYALIDENYCNAIKELVNIRFEGHLARIHYETYMMLYDARLSLRPTNVTRQR